MVTPYSGHASNYVYKIIQNCNTAAMLCEVKELSCSFSPFEQKKKKKKNHVHFSEDRAHLDLVTVHSNKVTLVINW